MRIKALHIKRYGAIRDWGPVDFSPGVCVVHGPNETGKSTMFDLLTSMLYGFSPAKAAKHPYTSWEDDHPLDFEAALVLQDDRVVQVNRRLLNTPRGTLVRGEAAENIANRPLPFVQHVNRNLYQALYALTAYDFHNLHESHQTEIQDRLLGELTTTRFRPVSRVLQELEREANKLWRTDRRRTRYSDLQEELRLVKGKCKEAVKREAELQQHLTELGNLQAKRDTLERERARYKALVRQAEALAPVAGALQQLAEWRRDIGDTKRLAALPVDIAGELKRRQEKAGTRETELAGIRDQLQGEQEAITAFGDGEQRVLDRGDDIREWVRRAEAHDQERQSMGREEDEIRLRRERLSELAEEVLAEPWSEALTGSLVTIAPAELKTCITNCAEKQETLRQCRDARRHKEHNAPRALHPAPGWIGYIFGAAGLLLGVFGWLGANLLLQAGAVTALVVAAGVLILGRVMGHTSRQLREQHTAELSRLQEEEKAATRALDKSRQRLATLLKPLPLAAGLLEQPQMPLYESVIKLRHEVIELNRLAGRLKDRQRKWQAERSRLKDLADDLGEFMGDWAGPVVDRLAARLAEAGQAGTAHDLAVAGLTALVAKEQNTREELEKLQKEQAQLEQEMLEVAGLTGGITGDDSSTVLKKAAARVSEMQHTLSLLNHHETELQRQYVNLAALQEEIRGLENDADLAWVLDRTEVELAKERLEELEEQHRELVELIVKLDSDIKGYLQGPSPGELYGQVTALEEELEALARERDRLMLMRMVLQRADREFRERHQPDVLRRASAYLEKITGGRYNRLMMLTTEDSGDTLVVQRHDRAEPVTVEHPLSRGTLDQIFLAFRLAVIDHLDAEHETLPIFLDEGLVNWDDARLENGLQLFQDISAARQVFLFTCRHGLADLVTTRLGAPVIVMPETVSN
ncbi:MAG: AAA family ATPase [Bacillota bacterium]